MTTLFTAFLWGLGASSGASVGLIAFLLFKESLDWVCGRSKAIRDLVAKYEADTLAALVRRNDLTVETIASIDRIADKVEEFS